MALMLVTCGIHRQCTTEADAKNPWSYVWLGFCGEGAEKIIEEIGFTNGKSVIVVENAAAISNIITEEYGETVFL